MDQIEAKTPVLNLGCISDSLLIFGGPYSNLQATQALRKQAEALNILAENVICTGDIVAYCANPEETTDLIRAWGVRVVQGNCEESLASDALDCGCGFEENSACSLLSTGWYSFSRTRVSAENKQWMADLPKSIEFEISGKRFQVVHGGLNQINRFVFEGSSPVVFEQELAQTSAHVVIGGHCGIPFHKVVDDQYWINAGVIGMPANDGTPLTWYVLLEPEQNSGNINVSWHRLSYDVSGAVEAMRDANLISPYMQALSDGLWPSMDVLPGAERERRGNPIRLEPIVIPVNP